MTGSEFFTRNLVKVLPGNPMEVFLPISQILLKINVVQITDDGITYNGIPGSKACINHLENQVQRK